MYNSRLFKKVDYNLVWFWEGVRKFNTIANPCGVNPYNQIPIIKSELQEILDSKDETSFMDGIIDGLVTLAPLVDDHTFKVYFNPLLEKGVEYDYLKNQIEEYLENEVPEASDHTKMADTLLAVLVSDETHFEQNVESVLESNLSKYIPVKEYKDSYHEEVVNKYPQHEVHSQSRFYQGEEFIVFFNENGKVLKGHSYFKEPELICN